MVNQRNVNFVTALRKYLEKKGKGKKGFKLCSKYAIACAVKDAKWEKVGKLSRMYFSYLWTKNSWLGNS